MRKPAFSTKKVLIIILFVIAISVVLTDTERVKAAEGDLPSTLPTGISYIVYESVTGQTLLRQNSEVPTDASLLSRLMTCLLILENPSISITDSVSPVEDSVSASGRYKLYASSRYMVDHLLKSVILCNADNAARLLASLVNPKTEYFVSIMNQKAAELGLVNTFFTSPDGAADQLQRTTVQDMSLFWAYAMKNVQFRDIAEHDSVHIWSGTAVPNECKMVSANNTAFPDATLTAGAYALSDPANNLGTTVFYLTNKTSESAPVVSLVLVMAGVPHDASYEIGNNYVNNALSNFKKTPLVAKKDLIIATEIGGSELLLEAGETCYCMMPIDVTNYIETISYRVIDPNSSTSHPGNALFLDELTLPIEEGTAIGTANYLLKDGSVHAVTLIAGNSIHFESKTINTFYKIIKENTDIFILISVLLLCELLLAGCVIVNKIRRTRNR